MTIITKIANAKKGAKSLKTTVPEGIVEFIGLSDDDQLEWKMEVKDDERIAIIKKKT